MNEATPERELSSHELASRDLDLQTPQRNQGHSVFSSILRFMRRVPSVMKRAGTHHLAHHADVPDQMVTNTRLVLSPSCLNIIMYLLMHGGAMLCFFVRPRLDAIAFAIGLHVVTAGLGWSVGIHRGLVHGAFKTHRWVENCLAALGAMSGLGGPLSTSRMHFLRDYCQSRQGIRGASLPQSFWRNYFCLPFFCKATLEPAPKDEVSERLRERTFFHWLENRWLITGLVAVSLYLLGGLTYVAWGLCARIVVTANTLACFDYFCHATNHGSQRFRIEGASCEGRNHWLIALLTFGEGWHNNHHAMPSSPRMGLTSREVDLGYAMIRLMQRSGLAWDLVTPSDALKPNAWRL